MVPIAPAVPAAPIVVITPKPSPTPSPSPSPTPAPSKGLNIFTTLDLGTIFATGLLPVLNPNTWCVRGDGRTCADSELRDPRRYRQVLVLPTGYTSSQYQDFRDHFSRLVSLVGSVDPAAWTQRYRQQVLYVGAWFPGGALDSAESSFGGKVLAHPIRGKALTLRQADVISAVSSLQKGEYPLLSPFAVFVLFNTTEPDITANASPPSVIGGPYGIAKGTVGQVEERYVPVHEIAHAGLNFLDEYIEAGLDEVNIAQLDVITPLAQLDGTWGGWVTGVQNLLGVYQYRFSEIVGSNGSDNIDVTRYPSRVATSGYAPNEYEYEGGMFFGRGTWHDRGNNIMNSNRVMRGADDGFAYGNSGSQNQIVDQAFNPDAAAHRPNDRLRNAGPLGTWSVQWGGSTRVMLFDGDKYHHFHPTLSYDVEVQWQERVWKVCVAGFIPYPCYDDVWRTARKTGVQPQKRFIEIRRSSLYGVAGFVQKTLCYFGVNEIASGEGSFRLCESSLDEISSAFLPTLVYPMPYQDVDVPVSQWMTTYYWRFRTHNSAWTSGYTGWSSFYRAL